MRPVQIFTKEYLSECRKLTPEQIVKFLEEFMKLHGPKLNSKSKLISLKVPEDLLSVFRQKAELEGISYQTQIKVLMKQWVG